LYEHFLKDITKNENQELGFPSERLVVSILDGDEETAEIWKRTVSLPDSKIFRSLVISILFLCLMLL
jgi:alanyl-tRNA synthetase